MSVTNQSQQNHSLIIMSFREMVEANLSHPLKMPDVCIKLGISTRTLRYVCQKYLGLSPTKYVKQRRMSLAREALLRNDARVTDVATEFGFFELGRFSVQYRQLYGELPSITARIRHCKA